jgi:hypothetical protein
MNEDEARELAEDRVNALIDKGYFDESLFKEKVKQMMKTLLDEQGA